MEDDTSEFAFLGNEDEIPNEEGILESAHSSDWSIQIAIGLFYVSVFLGLFGNSWLIYYLLRFCKLNIVQKVCLMNRAVADLFYVFNVLHWIVTTTAKIWNFELFTCHLYLAIGAMQPFTPLVFLAVMSADIFIGRRYPAKAKKWRTPRTAVVVSLVLWTLTTFFVLPIAYHAEVIEFDNTIHCAMSWSTFKILDIPFYILHHLVGGYIIPLFILFVITVVHFCTRNFKPSNGDDTEGGNRTQECTEPLEEGIAEMVIEETSNLGTSSHKEGSRGDLLSDKLVFTMSTLVFVFWLPYFVLQIQIVNTLNHGLEVKWVVTLFYRLAACLMQFLPAINSFTVILISTKTNLRQYLLRACSFSSICAQVKKLNLKERRARRNSHLLLHDPTILNDVEGVEK